jgi:hypothetical protein
MLDNDEELFRKHINGNIKYVRKVLKVIKDSSKLRNSAVRIRELQEAKLMLWNAYMDLETILSKFEKT